MDVYPEDDLLPISGLQHLSFCERQWGLIYLEGQWEENRLTAEGRVLHERVHDGLTDTRRNLVVTRGIPLRCLRLGLTGQADAVEFHRLEESGENVVILPGRQGWWRPFPVEYKRGKPKPDSCDQVQLCAQALCLEEMLGVAVSCGALFYGQPRRRFDVPFDAGLRTETEELCQRMHKLYSGGSTPAPVYAKKCEGCSLINRCLPRAPLRTGAVETYFRKALAEKELAL